MRILRRLIIMATLAVSLAATVSPAMASSARPTVVEAHRILGVNVATHNQQPYWTYSNGKLTKDHGGVMWGWHNIGVTMTEYDPYWIKYPVGTTGFGVFYSKLRFNVGITKYGLPLGIDWTCQIASNCYPNGSVFYGETCNF